VFAADGSIARCNIPEPYDAASKVNAYVSLERMKRKTQGI
jgi:hypothetical protein